MTPTILCCGEALIDMLPRTSDRGEAAFAPVNGGAVYNTAIALGRLGARVGFFCGLSRDLFGERLAQGLIASGVDIGLCPRSDRPTTLAFVTLTDGQARYAFYDEGTALRAMTEADLPPLPEGVRALFFGCISLVSEPCGSAFEALCHRAGERVVMLDPNPRPGFGSNEAAYRARLGRMVARADILKFSDEDLAWLFPDRPEGEAIAAMLAQGAALVFVTRGARGAEVHHGRGVLRAAARRVAVVDTVGAGDTFDAGVLSVLERVGALTRPALRALPEALLREALETGVRAAAVTVSRAGANPPWAAELA
jgi:fructokinase